MARQAYPLAVACFIGSVIFLILCVLGWDDRSREGKPLGTINVGRNDEWKVGLVCAMSALVFITLLARTFSDKSKHNLRTISQFGHVIRSPILPALVTASMIIIIATILLIVSVEEVFKLRGYSEYLMMGILFLGSGSLILMCLFGFRHISQQAKVLSSSPADSSEESDIDVLDETSKDKEEYLGLWSGAIKPFIKTTSGMFILWLGAFAPSVAFVFFIFKPSELKHATALMPWTCVATLVALAIFGYLLMRPLKGRNKWIRRFAHGLMGLIILQVTATGLFYGIENYRGEKAWEDFKSQWEAKGETFDLQKYLLPALPDEKNFALTPLLAPFYRQKWDESHSFIGWIDEEGNVTPEMKKGRISEITDSPTTRDPQTAAKDVLLELARFKDDFDQLREDARNRPQARYYLHHEAAAECLLPHLSPLKGLTKILGFQAQAYLQDGQPDAALEDVELIYFLAGTIRQEPGIISHLVYWSLHNTGLVPILEGLAQHQWQPEHLERLQNILGDFDLLKDVERSFRSEALGLGMPMMESLATKKFKKKPESMAADIYYSSSMRWIPRGWIRQNQIQYCRSIFEYASRIDTKAHRIYPQHTANKGSSGPKSYSFLARRLMPGSDNMVLIRMAKTQTKLDLAIIACALEHHRLIMGNYPQSLEDLSPKYLKKCPHEVFTGKPYIYKQLDQKIGSFHLYSVGADMKDSGANKKTDIVWGSQ